MSTSPSRTWLSASVLKSSAASYGAYLQRHGYSALTAGVYLAAVGPPHGVPSRPVVSVLMCTRPSRRRAESTRGPPGNAHAGYEHLLAVPIIRQGS
jgi:hypothetical protein